MKIRFLCLALLLATPLVLPAQIVEVLQVEVIGFRVALSPTNQIPDAVISDSVGGGDIWIKLYRNTSGAARKAVVDFDVNWRLGQPETLTEVRIHSSRVGGNGPAVIDTELTPIDQDQPGAGHLFRQVEITDRETLAEVEGILAEPGRYYVNIETMSNPAGLLRGQLRSREEDTLGALSGDHSSLQSRLDAQQALLERVAARLGLVP